MKNTSSNLTVETREMTPVRIDSENTNILEGVKRMAELCEFVIFCATPRKLRTLKTQRDFAKMFRVDEDSLTAWKRLPGFWDEVRKEIQGRERDEIAEVIHGLREKALEGDVGAVRLWMQYVGAI